MNGRIGMQLTRLAPVGPPQDGRRRWMVAASVLLHAAFFAALLGMAARRPPPEVAGPTYDLVFDDGSSHTGDPAGSSLPPAQPADIPAPDDAPPGTPGAHADDAAGPRRRAVSAARSSRVGSSSGTRPGPGRARSRDRAATASRHGGPSGAGPHPPRPPWLSRRPSLRRRPPRPRPSRSCPARPRPPFACRSLPSPKKRGRKRRSCPGHRRRCRPRHPVRGRPRGPRRARSRTPWT